MARPVLFDYFRSSASYRVRIALNLKGVDHDRMPIDLVRDEQHGPDYLARNPQGRVPMLEIDGLRLTQSLAIADYLDATKPAPRLVPDDPADRAHVLALALTIACDVHPLNNLAVIRFLNGELGLDKAATDSWYRHWVLEGLAALEKLAKPRAGRFLFGDAPSLADVCLVPQLFNARRFAVPLDDFPLLLGADVEANRIEAFAAAHPDRVAPAG
jgi:maleylacetoacetate isomerase